MKTSVGPVPYIADIHSHVLPYVDDGANDIEEALEMLAYAQAEGITHIICTPHYKSQQRSCSKESVKMKFEKLKQKVQLSGSKIQLYLGNEVFYTQDLEEIIEKEKIFLLNQSNYLLVEFHPTDSFRTIRNGLDDVYSLGMNPILAHAERYECLCNDITCVEELCKLGVKIQVNASSVIGENGFKIKKFVKKLLNRELVDYVATDAHSTRNRTFKIKKCRSYLYHKYDHEYINKILFENAIEDLCLNQ